MYKTIYADPPWALEGGGPKGIRNFYPVMSFDKIKLMGDWIDEISTDNSHLYMWAVSNYLPEALETMRAWGYRYITNIAWVKDKIGMGYYFRTKHELLLFGVKGETILPKNRATPSIIEAPRRKHSAKPHEFYNLIEGVSRGPYLELFARNKRDGWHSWGNEVECDVTENYGFWQPPLIEAA